MLDFKKPEISDKIWVDKCLETVKSMNCEYVFGNTYIWSIPYSTQICRYDGFFMCRWGKGKDIMYSVPLGEGNFKNAIDELRQDAASLGIPLRLYGVTDGYREMLEQSFPDKFTFEYDEGNFDYIYLVEKMASLSGKKYHSKRNHITNFKKNNPSWKFEPISKDNISDCIDLHTQWISQREEDEDFSFEFESVLDAFENFDELGFIGGLIRVDGKAIAYTLGEKQSDNVFITHFEKAPADMQGAYAIINQEFTRNCLSGFEYVNREEDLGIEGLRKAKQSYKPEIILRKAIAYYNE